MILVRCQIWMRRGLNHGFIKDKLFGGNVGDLPNGVDRDFAQENHQIVSVFLDADESGSVRLNGVVSWREINCRRVFAFAGGNQVPIICPMELTVTSRMKIISLFPSFLMRANPVPFV